MPFEPTVIVNGMSQIAASVVSLLLALKLKRDDDGVLQRPFYLLSLALFLMALLNTGWFFGLIEQSELDNMLILPFFHLAILAIFLYICVSISCHDHYHYLIPIFLMSINALLLFKSMAVLCDVITGLFLIGIFFYVGFVDRHFMKKVSYVGMLYGLFIAAAAVLAQFTGISYLESFWFIPGAVLFYMLFMMLMEGVLCSPAKHHHHMHHIPLVWEVFRLGFFVVCLSIFIMLGMLGVHELGHSLAAKAFGCEHSTTFGIGQAVTHVTCTSGSGAVLITLGGLVLTLLISLMMYFMGNEFSKKLSLLMFAFSMIISVDDFSALGLPNSVFVIITFLSALLIVYGLASIVRNYEEEYYSYESAVCRSSECGEKGI
ncbi:hypothetical protein JW898_00790 [Candidatus Woesearchaeota archaeon]|nr:hypothetical protein [Candidatus Woesearchaeota archaeon]